MQTKGGDLSLNYATVEREILQFIRKIAADSGSKGAVIGLSGGIDSSVVGALLVRALGKEKVIGIMMPASHTPKQDNDDARLLAKTWGIRTYEVGIDPVFSAFEKALPKEGENRIAYANVKARIRMIINYYVANSHGMLVAGTGDKSEDEIGFFSKFGDGGVDFLPIAHLYKTQVRELGHTLDCPSTSWTSRPHRSSGRVTRLWTRFRLSTSGSTMCWRGSSMRSSSRKRWQGRPASTSRSSRMWSDGTRPRPTSGRIRRCLEAGSSEHLSPRVRGH